jgi:Right handed beta helix region/PKD domain
MRYFFWSNLVLLLCGIISEALSKELRVSDPAQLTAALKDAQGDDRILLAPGVYGSLILNAKHAPWAIYGSPVIIASEQTSNPALFTSIILSGVQNISFDSLALDYTYAANEPIHLSPFMVKDCSGISFENSLFDGDDARSTGTEADGFGTGKGLTIMRSKNIQVEGNKFFGWHRGAVFSEVDGLVVSRNEFHGLRSDGMDFASVQNALIDGNTIRDFRKSEKSDDHPDMIQFWTAGTKAPSVNVTIRGNILDQGASGYTQSIFMRNELVDQKKAGDEMFYRNIVIADNIIRNAHLHGITVGETDGLVIESNTLIQSFSIAEGGTMSTPAINVSKSARNVRIARNVVPYVNEKTLQRQNGWEVADNFLTQRENPFRLDHYRYVFANAEKRGSATLGDLRILPAAGADKAQAGSRLSHFDMRPERPDGFIISRPADPLGRSLQFDGTNVFGPSGKMNEGELAFSWNFGDGRTGNGSRPLHRYASAGEYDVVVNVLIANSERVVLKRTMVIP